MALVTAELLKHRIIGQDLARLLPLFRRQVPDDRLSAGPRLDTAQAR